MAQGDTNVQIVSEPINAVTIKAALDNCISALSVSGSYVMAPFSEGRAMAIFGVIDKIK